MATMSEIAEEADKIFHEMFSVKDILKGNTIEMHKEAWDIANLRLQPIWSLWCIGFEMNANKLTYADAMSMKYDLFDEGEYELKDMLVEPTYKEEAKNV